MRAAKYLGERMKYDPSKVYQLSKFWEADEGGHLSKTDLPRVVAARMLADLAVMHPEAKRRAQGRRRGQRARLGQGQAAAARQRAALPRRRRLGEGAERHARLGLPQEGAPQGGRAAALPLRVRDRAERAPLPRLDEGRALLREARRPVQAQEGQEDGHHPGRPRRRGHRDARHGPPRGGLRRGPGPGAVGRPARRQAAHGAHRGRDLARGGAAGRVRGARLVRRRQDHGSRSPRRRRSSPPRRRRPSR